ncbi:enoyl-CoA hydratase/carnithine racemase [Corynebacterium kutscheri]|uniref:Enoyl-CoA hydratase/carnithine racemase n=1 Tax=Corynebacterium kutscheri TaxID=35755 RepID=A0A0F6TDS0_9CORY|nr:enoyl-CoA hydratase [Corynebacterium kutscheri]AKE41879.1 enoyl-CoA hydratase/carnithine racemase [Corynebacterium kutscheri]VEH10207.1 Enoyl-CoA hydratase echA6 [Corynebacterium kutscheri]
MKTTLLVEDREKIRILKLNRPEKRNALSIDLCNQIKHAVVDAEQKAKNEDLIRAIIIRGEGRAFCSGADLSQPVDTTADKSNAGVYSDGFRESLAAMLRALCEVELPVIADIDGPAVGAGMQLSLACDFRLVGERAWFSIPATKLGFALDSWTIQRAHNLLGGGYARRILMAAYRLSAVQAIESGFALEKQTAESSWYFAQEISSLAPLAIAHHKKMLNNYEDISYNTSIFEPQNSFTQCWQSDDVLEARRARQEGRSPVFRRR